jgi:hypothetical protein
MWSYTSIFPIPLHGLVLAFILRKHINFPFSADIGKFGSIIIVFFFFEDYAQ